jgi:hypothetical protein
VSNGLLQHSALTCSDYLLDGISIFTIDDGFMGLTTTVWKQT